MHKALVRSRLCAGKLFIASFFCARGPSYCFCLPAVDGDVLKEKTMAMNLSILINPDDPEFSMAWASFFLNPEGVRLLLQESDLGLVTTVLSSGLLWDGSG